MIEFFQTNRDVVYFIYGQAFFVLGLAVAFGTRKRSQLALAAQLWLLALFGLVHGIYEWGFIFIPLQQPYLSQKAVNALHLLQLTVETLSFLALYQFGIELSAFGSRHPRILRAIPTTMAMLWLTAFSVLWLSQDHTLREIWSTGDALARYLIGVPGAMAAAWGLARQARHISRMDLPHIAGHLRGAAFAFAIYAGASMIVPRGDYFPANVLNYEVFMRVVGIPVVMFRALCGITIAYLIIRAMEIFNVETERQLEEAAQARAIAADRERIGRELHDGTIQALYAAGLHLEDAALTIEENAPLAKEKINAVIHALNRTIRDIRSYILDLRRDTDTSAWQSDLGEMTRAFRLQTLVDAEFQIVGEPHGELSTEAKQHIAAIVRESLTNIAKHARATRVVITLSYAPTPMTLEIVDNGIGFTPERAVLLEPGLHQGLRNMHARAQLIGACLAIESAPHQGTRVRLTLPNDKSS